MEDEAGHIVRDEDGVGDGGGEGAGDEGRAGDQRLLHCMNKYIKMGKTISTYDSVHLYLGSKARYPITIAPSRQRETCRSRHSSGKHIITSLRAVAQLRFHTTWPRLGKQPLELN